MITRRVAASVAALTATSLLGCDREARRWDEPRAAARRPDGVPKLTLHAGPTPGRVEVSSRPVTPYRYDGNAWAVAEGGRLFDAFNCSGCHAHAGGGGMGPPLRDQTWIYGADAE